MHKKTRPKQVSGKPERWGNGEQVCVSGGLPAEHTLKQGGMGTSSLQNNIKGTKIIVIQFSRLESQWSILMKESM